jgi:hypothetical protein
MADRLSQPTRLDLHKRHNDDNDFVSQMRYYKHLQELGVTDETERREREDLASVLLMTVCGIPIIFWGDKQCLA